MKNVTGIEVTITPFSDHNGVLMKMVFMEKPFTRGRYYWKLNSRLMEDTAIKAKFVKEWEKIQRSKRYYPDIR